MYTTEQLRLIANIVEDGIKQTIETGGLVEVDYGYCAHCDTEGAVYDIGPDYPTQPAICHKCLLQQGINKAVNNQAVRDLIHGTEGSD